MSRVVVLTFSIVTDGDSGHLYLEVTKMIFNKENYESVCEAYGITDDVIKGGKTLSNIPMTVHGAVFWAARECATPQFDKDGKFLHFLCLGLEERMKVRMVLEAVLESIDFEIRDIDRMFEPPSETPSMVLMAVAAFLAGITRATAAELRPIPGASDIISKRKYSKIVNLPGNVIISQPLDNHDDLSK